MSRQYHGPTNAPAFGAAAPSNQFYNQAPPQAPPSIGHGPSNLFGGIMAGTSVVKTPAPVNEESSSLSGASRAREKDSKKYGEVPSIESNVAVSTSHPSPKRRAGPALGNMAEKASRFMSPSPAQSAPAPALVANTWLKKKKMSQQKCTFQSEPAQFDHSPTSSLEFERKNPTVNTVDWSSKSLQEKVARLIELQTFEGSWPFDVEVFAVMGMAYGEKEGVDKGVWVTLLVIKWLEIMAGEEEGVWSMVVEKARGWLESQGEMGLDALENEAESVAKRLQAQ
jgi:hypothetical protein